MFAACADRTRVRVYAPLAGSDLRPTTSKAEAVSAYSALVW